MKIKVKKVYNGNYKILIGKREYTLEKQSNGWVLECEEWSHEMSTTLFPFLTKKGALDALKSGRIY